MPVAEGGPPSGPGEVGQEFLKSLVSMGGQLDGARDRVDEPTQENLGRLPGAVALQELLHRDGVPAKLRVGGVIGTKNFVDGVEQDLARPTAPPGGPWATWM